MAESAIHDLEMIGDIAHKKAVQLYDDDNATYTVKTLFTLNEAAREMRSYARKILSAANNDGLIALVGISRAYIKSAKVFTEDFKKVEWFLAREGVTWKIPPQMRKKAMQMERQFKNLSHAIDLYSRIR